MGGLIGMRNYSKGKNFSKAYVNVKVSVTMEGIGLYKRGIILTNRYLDVLFSEIKIDGETSFYYFYTMKMVSCKGINLSYYFFAFFKGIFCSFFLIIRPLPF